MQSTTAAEIAGGSVGMETDRSRASCESASCQLLLRASLSPVGGAEVRSVLEASEREGEEEGEAGAKLSDER